jgi:ABC-type transporter Mla subunit MlaD
MRAFRPAPLLVVVLVPSVLAAAGPLDLVVDFTSSKGIGTGAAVRSGPESIGRVVSAGFGAGDTVEVRLRIDLAHREAVREKSTFVIVAREGDDSFVEHYVLDPSSPPAQDGARLEGAFSVAEVWLRRGRISSEELNRALEHGMDELRENLETLRRSPEWENLRDDLANMASTMRSAGEELARLLEEQLPRLRRELEEIQRKTEEELARRRATPTP